MHLLNQTGAPTLVIRTFQPQATEVSVIRESRVHPMHLVHPEGFFEAVFPGEAEFFPYEFSITIPAPARLPNEATKRRIRTGIRPCSAILTCT
jgi:hypothetical protein